MGARRPSSSSRAGVLSGPLAQARQKSVAQLARGPERVSYTPARGGAAKWNGSRRALLPQLQKQVDQYRKENPNYRGTTPTTGGPMPKAPTGGLDGRLQEMQDLLKGQLQSARNYTPGYTQTPQTAKPTPSTPVVKPSSVSKQLAQQTANPLPAALNLEEAYRKQLDLMKQQMQQQAAAQNGILSQLQKQMQDEVAGRDKQLALYAEAEARQAEQEKLMMAERERSVLNQRRAYEESFMGATQRLRNSANRRAVYQRLTRMRPTSPSPEFNRPGASLLR